MNRKTKISEQERKFYENLEVQKDHIRRIENQVKKEPTNSDLKESVRLLKDFGIVIVISDIPDFRSVCELERWRIKTISEYFKSH